MPSVYRHSKPKPAKAAGSGMTRRRVAVIAVVLLLIGGGSAAGIAYALGYFGTDPRLAEVRAMQTKLMQEGKPPNLADKGAMEQAMAMWKKVNDLPPELKSTAQQDMGSQFMKMAAARAKKFSRCRPTSRRPKSISTSTACKPCRASSSSCAAATRVEIKAETRTPRSRPRVRLAARRARLPAALGVRARAADREAEDLGEFFGGGAPRSDADAAKRRNQFLSSVPPATRVQMNQYGQLVRARAVQRGISMPGRP